MSEIRTDTINNASGDNDSGIDLSTNDVIAVKIAGSEKARVDSSGNLLVGKTSTAAGAGAELRADGQIVAYRSNNRVAYLDRLGSDGDIVEFLKNGTTYGKIGNDSNNLYIVFSIDNDVGLAGGGGVTDKVFPTGNDGLVRDDGVDLGYATGRFDNIYATNGTIQTSDQNEKNTITDSDLGIDFIKRLTPKSYIFNGKTRTHYGLIAQDVETVLTDINKPTSGFAGFIKDDISEEQDGSEYRYGLRYTEFVAPLIQAVRDQQATIDALTARITALENGV